MVDGDLSIPIEELAVLQLLSRGYRIDQIARILQTTPAQVHTRLDQVMLRLGAATHSEAVVIAHRQNLIV